MYDSEKSQPEEKPISRNLKAWRDYMEQKGLGTEDEEENDRLGYFPDDEADDSEYIDYD